MAIQSVGIVGAGQMGNGIAHVLAAGGYAVTMIDVSDSALAKGVETITKNMDRQVKKGAFTADIAAAALSRIATATSLDAASTAQVVIEAATERTDLKFRIFEDLDRIAPAGAILASNTSSIAITEIATSWKIADTAIASPRPFAFITCTISQLPTQNSASAPSRTGSPPFTA